jgi:hypothetical protein
MRAVTETIEVMGTIEDTNILEFCVSIAHGIAHDLKIEMGNVGGSYLPVKDNSLILMRNEDGEPISMIIWQEWCDGAFIGLAWTDLRHRRRGLYGKLIERLEQECRARGLKHISAAVHGHNEVSMKAHMELLGAPWIVNFRKGLE